MLKNPKIKVVMIGLLLAASAFAWAYKIQTLRAPRAPITQKVELVRTPNKIAYDPALLNRLKQVFSRNNAANENYTISGNITVDNKADSSQKMDHIPFLFSKKDDSFYYRLGTTQTLNAEGTYLYIDSVARTVLFAAQKPITPNEGFGKMLTGMADRLEYEHYELQSTRKGGYQTISMVNEQHNTCKEYSVTIDTGSFQVKRILIRYADANDPMSIQKEKIVDVAVSQWENTADPGRYLRLAQVVKKDAGHYQAVGKYSKYELIKM